MQRYEKKGVIKAYLCAIQSFKKALLELFEPTGIQTNKNKK